MGSGTKVEWLEYEKWLIKFKIYDGKWSEKPSTCFKELYKAYDTSSIGNLRDSPQKAHTSSLYEQIRISAKINPHGAWNSSTR